MLAKNLNWEVVALVVLAIIPWPGPTIFKISCSRESASIVRKIIQKRWIPVLEKYNVKIPIECPFHQNRDIFGPQQKAKHQHRPSQWSCGFCGKSFYEEKYLDLHFDNVHKSKINMAEDAVCLADYCDIMRCEVFLSQELNNPLLNEKITTDVEIWRETTVYRTALTLTGSREVAKILPKHEGGFNQDMQKKKTNPTPPPGQNSCSKTPESGQPQDNIRKDSPGNDGDGNITKDVCETNDMVDSVLPPKEKNTDTLGDLQKFKANCKPEELEKLKIRCEELIRNCIAGLLINLFEQDFKDMEEELNKGICWYLTCDRYWEDFQSEMRPFPWGLVFIFVIALSLGICLVYYAIWVLFDTDDEDEFDGEGIGFESESFRAMVGSPRLDEYYHVEGEYRDTGPSEHYIYVTYPPELKRRLLERTTRI